LHRGLLTVCRDFDWKLEAWSVFSNHYTHANAVKHGLVQVANQYPWCSAAWFERMATAAQVKTIYGFKIDQLHVYDDYEPAPDWKCARRPMECGGKTR
jgi:hypothetical protein